MTAAELPQDPEGRWKITQWDYEEFHWEDCRGKKGSALRVHHSVSEPAYVMDTEGVRYVPAEYLAAFLRGQGPHGPPPRWCLPSPERGFDEVRY